MPKTASDPRLVWPRTDGDPSRWPKRHEPNQTGVFEKLPEDDAKYTLYEEKVGQYLAEKMGLPKMAQSHRIPLPDGYAIFAHIKDQGNGEYRTDCYLYGSTIVAKFRSTAEFYEHAAWLMDTSRPLNDHSRCECKYNSQSDIARTKKLSMGSGPSKRQSMSGDSPRKKAKMEDQEPPVPGVPAERSTDLNTKRRFRKGELVWMRIDTISVPVDGKKRGLFPLTHWPALIANISVKIVTESADGSSGLGAGAAVVSSILGGSSTSAKQTIKHFPRYHLRPLGMFNNADQVIKDPEDLLPWQIGNELMGGIPGWDALGDEGSRILKTAVQHEAAAEGKTSHQVPLDERWRGRWGRRYKFDELPKEWAHQGYRMCVALRTAQAIAESWTQTDMVDPEIVKTADIDEADRQRIMAQEKTLYQGMWLGGERIWVDDLVRLKKNRRDLPAEGLKPPAPGAADRAVLLKIRVITLEIMQAQEAGANPRYQCLCYGDVFELAPAVAGQPAPPMPNDPTESWSSINTPPVGYTYRQLNEAGSEVTCDVSDIAGRLYPDLISAKTQNWYIDTTKMSDVKGRVKSGECVKALMGLAPGTVSSSCAGEWKQDLHTIVITATKKVEAEMKEYYARLLREAGVKLPDPVVKDVVNGATNGHAGAVGKDANPTGPLPGTLAQAMAA